MLTSLRAVNLKLKNNMNPEKNFLRIGLCADRKVIVETLTRIGVGNKASKILYPSCYLHTIGDVNYLLHFKQIFLLRENHYNNISDNDLKRRNTIAFCLKNWGMIEVGDNEIAGKDEFIFILPHREKKNWNIVHKINQNVLCNREDYAEQKR